MSLAFIALCGKYWESDYMTDRIFLNAYIKGKVAENKSQDRYWIDLAAMIHYRTHAGDRICLPKGKLLQALKTAHNSPGHFGPDKVYNILTNSYYRPKISNSVQNFVDHCPSCRINKTSR